jgi:hypothetical protein
LTKVFDCGHSTDYYCGSEIPKKCSGWCIKKLMFWK